MWYNVGLFWKSEMKKRNLSKEVVLSLVESGIILEEFQAEALDSFDYELTWHTRLGQPRHHHKKKNWLSWFQRERVSDTAKMIVAMLRNHFIVTCSKGVMCTDLNFELKRRAKDVARRLANLKHVA